MSSCLTHKIINGNETNKDLIHNAEYTKNKYVHYIYNICVEKKIKQNIYSTYNMSKLCL